jgi:hypothetical protein
MRTTYNRVCECCGVSFIAYHPNGKYCSINCKVNASYYRRSGRPIPDHFRVAAKMVQAEILDDPDELPPAWREAAAETQGLESRTWNGTAIQRRSDGYVNATAMAKANGKHLPHYLSNERTREYLDALSAVVGIPTSELVQSIRGGIPNLQGTWVHQRVAVDLARWVSPAFAVWMDGWFLESMTAPQRPALPPATGRTPPALPRPHGVVVYAPTEEAAAKLWCKTLQASASLAIWAQFKQPPPPGNRHVEVDGYTWIQSA